MVENIRLSFQGIWAHKLRSFLTMLGIIIGIASIISIVSTIKGTNEQIKMNLIGEGDNVVDITLNEGGGIYQMEYQGLPQGVPVLNQEQKQRILDLDQVENVTFYRLREYADSIFSESEYGRWKSSWNRQGLSGYLRIPDDPGAWIHTERL